MKTGRCLDRLGACVFEKGDRNALTRRLFKQYYEKPGPGLPLQRFWTLTLSFRTSTAVVLARVRCLHTASLQFYALQNTCHALADGSLLHKMISEKPGPVETLEATPETDSRVVLRCRGINQPSNGLLCLTVSSPFQQGLPNPDYQIHTVVVGHLGVHIQFYTGAHNILVQLIC